MRQPRVGVAHFEHESVEVAKVSGVVSLETMSQTIARPRLPAEPVHHRAPQLVKRLVSARQDFALPARQVLKVTSQRRQDLDMAGSPATDSFRLPHVNLASSPVDVVPSLVHDFLRAHSGESTEREICRQASFAVRGFKTSCHLIGRENCGLLVLQASLLQALHRVARNHFEKILAPTEKAPRDPKMIVDAYWRKPVERSQPYVEFSMADGVDRVSTVASDQSIENISDLIERHAGLLMVSDPQRGAFTKRDFASSVARLPFRAQEPLLLERDDVSERLLAITLHCLRGLLTATTLMPRAIAVAIGRYLERYVNLFVFLLVLFRFRAILCFRSSYREPPEINSSHQY